MYCLKNFNVLLESFGLAVGKFQMSCWDDSKGIVFFFCGKLENYLAIWNKNDKALYNVLETVMKKLSYSCSLISAVIFSASLLFSQPRIISCVEMEKTIEPKLCTEKTIFQNVSKEQLLEDFNAFLCFVSTSYIGCDEMFENGFVPDDFIVNIENKIEKNIIKTSGDLIKNIYWELKDYIRDSHFALANGSYVYSFNENLQAQNSGVRNYFSMAINKKSVYLRLPGFLPDFFQEESPAKEYFEKVYAEFENIKQKKYLIIDFRNCPGGVTDFPLLLLYSLYAGTESVVPSKIYDARQLESKIIYKSSESIETPITESLRYQRAIDTGNSKYEEIFRTSSVMQLKNPKRIVRQWNENSEEKMRRPAYKGKIIFLTNKQTASAAEIIILQSKVLFPGSIKIIGENTMGCLTYVDVFQIIMPNNSFAVTMAFKSIKESLKTFACWKGECEGIQPDVICSDKEIPSVLIKITKDRNLRY